jgi:hypothetical protein
MKLPILPLWLLLSAAFCFAAQTDSTSAALDKIASEFEVLRAKTLEPDTIKYRKDLHDLAKEALAAKDVYSADAATSEADSPIAILGLAPLKIPDGKNSSRLTRLRKLRSEYERAYERASRTALAWCAGELRKLEAKLLEANDAAGAALVRTELEAVSKPPLRILQSTFGASGAGVDLTLVLRKKIRFNRLHVRSGTHLAGDPLPYRKKSTFVDWQLGNARRQRSWFEENALINLP